MTEITVRKPLLNGFKDVELRPDLYRVDVLGAHVQVGINSEWQRMGETLVRRLDSHQKKAVLISTMNLEHFLTEEVETSNLDNSSSFEHEGKRYVVTFLDQSKLKQTLPDICKSEEFVFGLNTWLCFLVKTETSDAHVLCEDEGTAFLAEIKSAISNLNALDQLELKIEFVAAISDGCELLWFNPRR